MGCGASSEVLKKQYVFRVRLLGGLNLYNNGFGVQVPGTYSNAGRFDGASDPYCILECSGSKDRYESSVRLHTQNPVWNEEFYFNTSTKAPVLTIKVKDKEVVAGDELLGIVHINLQGLISQEKERTIWVPLEKAKAGGEIGIAVVEAFRTHIVAKSGQDVKPMDTLSGSSDVYMTLQVGQQPVQKTKVKSWTLNPVWDETFSFFVPYGIKSQVAMILYDHDKIGSDKNMGWHYEYFDGKPQKGPRDLKVPITNAQGTLLFHILDDTLLVGVSDQPVAGSDAKPLVNPSETPSSCTIDVRVLGAFNLAVADKNFAGDFANAVNSWGWHEFKEYTGSSDPFARVTCEGTTYDTRHINNTLEPEWNEKFRFVCRNRESSQLKVEVLDNDLLVNDSIGAVTIPLNAMKPGRKQEIWSYLDRGRGEIGVEVLQHHQLAVRIVSCSNLPEKDNNGMCDPYIKLHLAGDDYQTRVVRNDRNPWFEEDFRFCLATLHGQKLRLQCWDSDLMFFNKGLSEDLIGTVEIDVSALVPGLPTEFDVPLAIAGNKKDGAKIKVIITEEVPLPESVIGELKKKGEEAFAAAVKKMNEAKEMVSCLKLPDFDKKEEAKYDVADAKLAPRPRFSKITVDVVALRKLKDIHEPYYVGVSLPLQGKRYKTKEVRGKSGVDFEHESFTFNVPSKVTGALEFKVFESAYSPYTEWSEKCYANSQVMLQSLNDNEGTIRGSKANDEWLPLSDGKGQIVVRVSEMFRFQVRVVGATDLKSKKQPYVTVVLGDQTKNTSYVSADPAKDRTQGVVGSPIWDEQFTLFAATKGNITFKVMELGMTGDDMYAKADFDLNTLRRGIPTVTELPLSKGGKLKVEILEEEKMVLLDRIIDAAGNAKKLAESLAGEIADSVSNAAADAKKSAMNAIGKLF